MTSNTTVLHYTGQLHAIQHGLSLAQAVLEGFPDQPEVREHIAPLARELVLSLLRLTDNLRARAQLGNLQIDLAMAALLRKVCHQMRDLLRHLSGSAWGVSVSVHTSALQAYAEDLYYLLSRRAVPDTPA